MKLAQLTTLQKAAIIMLGLAFVASGGWYAIHAYNTRDIRRKDDACTRAAEYHRAHHGPLDELTIDDSICQGY
jgi:hypothetical protein